MINIDESLSNLSKIENEFKDFCDAHGGASEADTRVKLIDKILTKVCGWPESNLTREVHSESGYSDYILDLNGKPSIVVEAKRVGDSFLFPQDNRSRSLKINGAILTSKNIKEAIVQVRSYCDDNGIRYAIATNGYSWIVFRAIKENGSWKEGYARIFPSLLYIKNNFIDFWNLLSFNALSSGSLDQGFGTTLSPQRNLDRVLSRLNNPDMPLLRNSLHTQLTPVITNFFEDIADPEHLNKLKNCYVYSESLRTTATDMNYVIKDRMPNFLKKEGAVDISQTSEDSGQFGDNVDLAVDKEKGQLFLLLGGIGSGKTTFQKRYQLTVGKETLDTCMWFVLDFINPPHQSKLEDFVWESILSQMRRRYQSPHLEIRRNIKRVFKPEIEALKQTELYGLKEETPQYESILTKHLTKWQENISQYVPRLLSLAKPKQNVKVVLFFDNVDQLSPTFQAAIFLLAQNVTGKIGSITIVALREESYYTASVQKVFTAYVNRKFHIASPPFRKMIAQRIKFTLDVFDTNSEEGKYFETFFNTSLFYQEDKAKISDFLKIVEYSMFEKNKTIGRFIDHICFGNMRMGLQMFSTFLVSGATDIDKMLRIFRKDGNYLVAFHEFLRSIMLGDRFYYKETDSEILNLFECGSERNSSHFTSIRLLNILKKLKGNYDIHGRGYVEINKLLTIFDNKFNNTQDVIVSMNRLLPKQLVEVNTRSTENIMNATHMRITSSGWYYITYLAGSFSYLDLVLQDTPINSEDVVKRLVTSVINVNNLGGRDDEKVQRMEERVSRGKIFLEYLVSEEDQEKERFGLANNAGEDFPLLMSDLISKYDAQTEYIRSRVKINAEAYLEEKFQNQERFEGLLTDEDSDESPELDIKA
jgi:hypothetical protein